VSLEDDYKLHCPIGTFNVKEKLPDVFVEWEKSGSVENYDQILKSSFQDPSGSDEKFTSQYEIVDDYKHVFFLNIRDFNKEDLGEWTCHVSQKDDQNTTRWKNTTTVLSTTCGNCKIIHSNFFLASIFLLW